MAQNFDFCWFPKIERRCKSFKSECVEDNSKLLLWQTAAYMNTSGCKIYGCEYWSDVWKIIRSGKHIHFPPGSHPYKDFSVDLTHSPPKFIICLQKCQNSFGILARIALLKRDVFTFQIDGFFQKSFKRPLTDCWQDSHQFLQIFTQPCFHQQRQEVTETKRVQNHCHLGDFHLVVRSKVGYWEKC